MNKFKLILIIFICGIANVALISSINVYAAEKTISECSQDSTDEACIAYKSILENVFQCYQGNGVKTTIPATELKSVSHIYDSIFTKDVKLALPSGFKNISLSSKDNKQITCNDINTGKWKYDGLREIAKSLQVNGVSYPDTSSNIGVDEKEAIFKGLGYTQKSGSGDSNKQCFYISTTETDKYTPVFKERTDTYEANTDTICATVDQSTKKITKLDKVKNPDIVTNGAVTLDIKDNKLIATSWNVTGTKYDNELFSGNFIGKTFEELKNQITAAFPAGRVLYEYFQTVGTDAYGNGGKDHHKEGHVKNVNFTTEDKASGVTYTLDSDREKAGMKAVNSFSGGTNSKYKIYNDLRFTTQQAAMLLEGYLVNFYGGVVKIPSDDGSNINLQESVDGRVNIPTKWMDTKGTYNCAYISFPSSGADNKNAYVYALTLSPWHFDGKTKYYRDPSIGEESHTITHQLQTVLGNNTCDNFDADTNLDESDDAKSQFSPSEIIEEQKDTDLQPDTGDDQCENVSGLAWLLCPIIELASNAVVSIYNNIVEPLLKVEPTLFKREGSGTFEAWSVFRNISNILLIIFFLVIIFSQLTGIGIDNYGIKKTLPRLITAALLINLSYIISQASVDLSNILGKSLNATFDSLADLANVKGAIPPSDSGIGGGIAAEATISVAVIGGTVAGITAAGGWAAVAGAALSALPAVVAALIAALIAVIFFFVLLGARQAGVVILVVISPLAFACYMLPNTKKFFDRWKKAFTALLLLYPIAGALMGGGGFTSAVLLNVNKSSDQNFWFQIVALLVQVIPFFFIPSLLKSSFAALGNIGNKISGFGQRLGRSWGGAAKRGISNSGTYKNAQLATANARAAARQERLQSSLDKKVAAGDYKDKDGNKITTYEGLSSDQKKAFAAANKDFRTQDKLMKMAADKKTQDDYAKGIAVGAYSTTDQTAATEEKSWGDAAISANTNALNNETYFETDEKEFTDDDGNSIGTYKYDHETNQWRKKLDGGKLGEALDTDRIVTDKDGQKWKTDKKGTLRKVKEDGSLGEAYKRKTFKGSDGNDYHFQDEKMVDKNGKELADGVTITDENGIKYQKSGDKYKAVDIEPVDIDKDATYEYDGHDCHFEGDKLFYEDDEGKKVEVGEGAEVQSTNGKNAGYSYKMGKNGLEFTKSKDIVTQDGRKLAFYADGKGGTVLRDVDRYESIRNGKDSKLESLQSRLKTVGAAMEEAKSAGLYDQEAKLHKEYNDLTNQIAEVKQSADIKDGTELGIGDVSFKYSRTSGTLAALNGTLKDDTAGFTYNGQALRLRPDNVFETENGIKMKSIDPGMPAIFRNDGSGVFKDIETGAGADPEQVAKAQAENKIKSYNDLRVMQSRTSDATQVGNMVGMLGANMENYTQNAVLGAQNKTINQINNTIGEGDAIRKAHSDGIETTTTSPATTQNIRKQFEATTGGNIAARERADTFKINQFDDNDIYNKATGTNALADLTAIANSTTERAGKRELARTMISSGVYNGGRAYDTADKARKFINTFKNAYDLGGERGEFTQEEIASIERLTPQQRHEVEDVLAGRSNAYDFLQNENVTDGQKLYLRQIWGGDTSVINRSNPVSIFSSDPSVQAYREAMMSAASAGRKVSAEAVIGKTTTQSNQAVDAAAIKNQNQFNMELAENNPAVTPVIDLEQAQFIAERKFNISEINRRHEVFSRQTRVDVEREFNDALNGVGTYAHDANAITALMHTLQEKGGHEVLMKSLKNNGTQIWRKLKSNGATESQISEIINTLTASNNMFEKDYGKTLMKILNYGGTASDLIDFDQYMRGTYGTITLPGGTIRATDKSMQAFIKNAGDNVIARTDKDNLQLIIENGLESWFTPKQMAQASLHPEDYGETAIKAYEALRLFGRAQDVVDSMSNNEACEIKQNMLCVLLGLPAGTNLKNLQFLPGTTQYKILNTLKGKRDKAHSVAQQNIDPIINDILDKHP